MSKVCPLNLAVARLPVPRRPADERERASAAARGGASDEADGRQRTEHEANVDEHAAAAPGLAIVSGGVKVHAPRVVAVTAPRDGRHRSRCGTRAGTVGRQPVGNEAV